MPVLPFVFSVLLAINEVPLPQVPAYQSVQHLYQYAQRSAREYEALPDSAICLATLQAPAKSMSVSYCASDSVQYLSHCPDISRPQYSQSASPVNLIFLYSYRLSPSHSNRNDYLYAAKRKSILQNIAKTPEP